MRVRIALTLSLLLARPVAFASAPGEITVSMSGFRSDQGKAYVALWRNGKGFPGTPPRSAPSRIVAIDHRSAEARFSDVTPGSFAITVFHDEDGDSELGENFLGIPKEGVGFSRNVRPRFRAPRYREAELTLEPGEHESVAITLQYL